jgi:replicative DNA helicase
MEIPVTTTLTRLPLGLAPLDALLGGGVSDGSLTLIAGRSGVGKTSLISQAVRHATLALGLPGYYAPLENGQGTAARQILSAETGIEHQRFGHQNTSPIAPWELERAECALEHLKRSALTIDTTVRTVAELDVRVRRVAAVTAPRIVAVDYPTALADLAGDFDRQIDEVALGLKEIAERYAVPVLVTCPLRRSPGSGAPGLSDFGQFTGLLAAADTALVLHRPDDHGPRAEIIAVKGHGGRAGSAEVYFEAPYVRFTGGER